MRPLVRVLRRGGHGREIDLEREPEITIVRHDGHAVPDQSDLPELLRNRPSDAAGREAA
jgi:hypothetical protein